jgi:hypothetical protein
MSSSSTTIAASVICATSPVGESVAVVGKSVAVVGKSVAGGLVYGASALLGSDDVGFSTLGIRVGFDVVGLLLGSDDVGFDVGI